MNRVVGEYTSLGIDMNVAQPHLQAATKVLQQGDLKAADQAPKAVEDDVIVASVAADMPLLWPRENLVLARTNAAPRGNYTQAKTELKASSKALSDYERQSGTHSSGAANLKSQVDSYCQPIQQNHSEAANKIESWWDPTSDWITPANGTSNGGSHS